jgi:hypothetical protein
MPEGFGLYRGLLEINAPTVRNVTPLRSKNQYAAVLRDSADSGGWLVLTIEKAGKRRDDNAELGRRFRDRNGYRSLLPVLSPLAHDKTDLGQS